MATSMTTPTTNKLGSILDHVDSVHSRLGLSLDPCVKRNVESMSDDIQFALNIVTIAQSNPLFSQLSQQCDPLRHIQDILRRCGLTEPHLSSFLFRLVQQTAVSPPPPSYQQPQIPTSESDDSFCDAQLEGQQTSQAGDTDDSRSSSANSHIDWELKSDPDSDSSCSVQSTSILSDEDSIDSVLQTRQEPEPIIAPPEQQPTSVWAHVDPMYLRQTVSPPIADAVPVEEKDVDSMSKRLSVRKNDPIFDPQREDELQRQRKENRRMYVSGFEQAHTYKRLDLSVGRIVRVYHAPWRTWVDAQIVRLHGDSYITLGHIATGKEIGTYHRNSSCIHVPSSPASQSLSSWKKLNPSARDLTEDSRDVRSLAKQLFNRGMDLNVQRWDFETVSYVIGTMYDKKSIDHVFRANKIRGSHLIDRAFNYHVVRDLFGRSRSYDMIGDVMEFLFVVRKVHELRHLFRSEFGGRHRRSDK